MAEKSNFGDLIKQLESSPSSIKKPREKLRPGVPSVSAVQMTDERGQLIKRESWAPKSGVLKASERKNKIKEDKNTALLTQISKGIGKTDTSSITRTVQQKKSLADSGAFEEARGQLIRERGFYKGTIAAYAGFIPGAEKIAGKMGKLGRGLTAMGGEGGLGFGGPTGGGAGVGAGGGGGHPMIRLLSTIKKPQRERAGWVQAVQLVNKKGKIVGESQDAKTAERHREALRRSTRTNILLAAILKTLRNMGGGLGGGKDKNGGDSLLDNIGDFFGGGLSLWALWKMWKGFKFFRPIWRAWSSTTPGGAPRTTPPPPSGSPRTWAARTVVTTPTPAPWRQPPTPLRPQLPAPTTPTRQPLRPLLQPPAPTTPPPAAGNLIGRMGSLLLRGGRLLLRTGNVATLPLVVAEVAETAAEISAATGGGGGLAGIQVPATAIAELLGSIVDFPGVVIEKVTGFKVQDYSMAEELGEGMAALFDGIRVMFGGTALLNWNYTEWFDKMSATGKWINPADYGANEEQTENLVKYYKGQVDFNNAAMRARIRAAKFGTEVPLEYWNIKDMLLNMNEDARAAAPTPWDPYRALYGASQAMVDEATTWQNPDSGRSMGIEEAMAAGLFTTSRTPAGRRIRTLIDIDKEALHQAVESGEIRKSTLQAIIDAKGFQEKDLEFMEQLLDAATSGNSLHVEDKGMQDRWDKIFPPDRSVVINQAGFEREFGVGAGSAGGNTTVVNTGGNSVSTNNNISGGIAARRPILLGAGPH